MTKGAKIFRIVICALPALTMICSAVFAALFLLHNKDAMDAEYGIYVADTPITRANEDDVLGDGTVYYDSYNNTLTFGNATIESEYPAVFQRST